MRRPSNAPAPTRSADQTRPAHFRADEPRPDEERQQRQITGLEVHADCETDGHGGREMKLALVYCAPGEAPGDRQAPHGEQLGPKPVTEEDVRPLLVSRHEDARHERARDRCARRSPRLM